MPFAFRPLLTALLAVAACVLTAASAAHAAGPTVPARGKVLTGVAMGESLTDFSARVGRRPAVWEHFIAFDRPYQWAVDRARGAGTSLMVHLSTADGQDRPGTITPRAIARGAGDRWLIALRDDLARLGRPAYVRFLGEMNNCHNAYAPLSCGGGSRGSAYSARATIAAWRRVTVIMRGGSGARVQARLRHLRQPGLSVGARDLSRAPIAMVWSPMTGGSPMVAALDPARFWPGRRWVDWVGTSFYSRYPNFRWLTPFYQRFAARQRKPFMFAEWAMWSNGDAGFVRQLLAWTATHRRTQMLVYNQGNRTSGPFRLRRFPAAQRALRAGLRHARFDA